jgi:glycosyltransferase involved in cell wall biosynthesis
MQDWSGRLAVVIPALNEEAFIGRLLESLAGQNYRNFAVVVVDSQSDDGTRGVAEQYRDRLPSLAVVRAPERGLALARNVGAEAAGPNDLVFLDADGEVVPTFLEELIQGLREKGLQIATTLVRPASRLLFDRIFYTVFIGYGLRILQHVFPIVTGSCIAVKREIFEKAGGFDPTIEFEDSAFARKAARYGHFGVLVQPWVTTSVRRLDHYGRWRTLFKLLFFGVFQRFFRGEMRQQKGFYRFGEYGKRPPPCK